MAYENPGSPGFLPPDPRNRASDSGVAERALKVVNEGFRACDNARGSLPDKWSNGYKAWRGQRTKKNYHGRANIVDPEPGKATETIVSRLEEAVQGTRPWARAMPRQRADAKQAQLIENLIQFQLDACGADSTMQEFLKNLVIHGSAILRVYWDEVYRKRPRRKRTPVQGLYGTAQVRYDVVAEEQLQFRGPRLRLVRIEDFYAPSLFCSNIQDQDFVIERRIVPYRTLWSLGQRGKLHNVEALKKEDSHESPHYDDIVKAERAAAADIGYDPSNDGKSSILKKCEVLMFEGAFDIDNDGIEEECWIWVVNGKQVVLCQENPYWHGKKSYVHSHYIRSPDEFYGVGLFDWIESLWAELNDTHNQVLDNKSLVLNPAFIAGVGSGITQSQLTLFPGKVIQAQGSVSEITPLIIPDMTAAGYNAIGLLRNGIRETTGATDLMQGSGAGGTDKATIYTGMLNEANMRLKHVLRNVYSMAIEPAITLMSSLNEQYIDEEMVVRVIGKDGFNFVPVRPEDLSVPMDWKGVGTGALSTLLQRNMGLERFVQVIMPFVQMGLPVNVAEVLKRYWQDGLGYTDSEQIFNPQGPAPLDPREENMLLEQRQKGEVDVHAQDDDIAHIKAHGVLGSHPDPVVAEGVQEHVQEHMAAFQQKKQQAQMQQVMQVLQMKMAMEGGNGGPQQGKKMAGGNEDQMGPDQGRNKEAAEIMAGRQG